MKTVTITCPACKGEGVVTPAEQEEFHLDEVCPLCDGEGWLDAEVDNEDSD